MKSTIQIINKRYPLYILDSEALIFSTRAFGGMFIGGMFLSLSILCGCGQKQGERSKPSVSDVHHTASKRQSIGNCWIYATASWIESLNLTETNETHNLSESYWTYWHWAENLRYARDKISTGGSWDTASQIIEDHGWMEEGDFIPGEAEEQMSGSQLRAERFVNEQLAPGGKLAKIRDRTKKKIMSVLDEAFGVRMNDVSGKVHKADELIVGHDQDGAKIQLTEVLSQSNSPFAWRQISYPRIYEKDDVPTEPMAQQRTAILKRVMKAVNDRQPVIMSVEVDFNALAITPYATFDLETLKAAGHMGRQGGHLLVLEDYTVKNVPGVGDIGEGDVSAELKAAALTGDLVSIKAKNSWGTDRPERGLIDGHTSFKLGYLDGVISWRNDEDAPSNDTDVSWRNPLSGFVLPPGY